MQLVRWFAEEYDPEVTLTQVQSSCICLVVGSCSYRSQSVISQIANSLLYTTL